MLDTNQTTSETEGTQAAAVVSTVTTDDAALASKLTAFIKDCFPDVEFRSDGLETKNGMDCMTFYAPSFPYEISREFFTIDGISILYEEISPWADHEYDLIATKGEYLMVVSYEFGDFDHNTIATIELHTGNALDVTTTATKIVQELLSQRVKNDAQALFQLLLRNSNSVITDTLNSLSAGFELEVNKENLEESQHNMMLIQQVSTSIKQAYNLNQKKAVEAIAPNISHVTFEVFNERDRDGFTFKSINDYTIHLVDGKKITIGFEDNWRDDDFIDSIVSYNGEIMPDDLKKLAANIEGNDEGVIDALAEFVSKELGGNTSDEFWFVSNMLDGLVWHAAGEYASQVNFANYNPVEGEQPAS